MPLTEATFASWIAEHPNCVILGWMENCSFCEQFKPIFELLANDPAFSNWSFASIQIARSGSEFKRLYMRANIGEKTGAPCVFVFRDGQYVTRHHGAMSFEALQSLILTGNVGNLPESKSLQHSSIIELKAFWLDHILAIERSQSTIRAIQTELDSRLAP
jgi:thioredoxin-like negative regulator of GroEL